MQFYINLPSEVPERMLANRIQRDRGRKEFNMVSTSAMLGNPASSVGEDDMKIELIGARIQNLRAAAAAAGTTH